MTKHHLAAAALAAISCMAMPSSAKAPSRVTVLSGSMARQVLHQCSRRTPAAGSSFFVPGAGDIEALDQGVARSRDARLPTDARKVSSLHGGYAVEIIGIFRSGRRFVYGSYYPLRMQEGVKDAPSTPVIVCDGGSRFFGAEIDAASGRITHLAFNGAR